MADKLLTIDRSACLLWIDEREVRLTPNEWEFFEYLYRHRHKFTSGKKFFADTHIDSEDVYSALRHIRKKMGREWIETRRSYGYRFIPQGEIIDVTPEIKNEERL